MHLPQRAGQRCEYGKRVHHAWIAGVPLGSIALVPAGPPSAPKLAGRRRNALFGRASAAGLLSFAANGGFKGARRNVRVVLTLTGNGLKDPGSAQALPAKARTCDADPAAFKRLLGAA